jgi:dTDP-4-amino-4,6-dideoxygalactose transaminase
VEKSELQRDQIIQRIFDQEVSVNVHFLPLPILTAYKNLGYKMEDYPETWNKYHNEITLPVYFDLSDESISKVIKAVKCAINQ